MIHSSSFNDLYRSRRLYLLFLLEMQVIPIYRLSLRLEINKI